MVGQNIGEKMRSWRLGLDHGPGPAWVLVESNYSLRILINLHVRKVHSEADISKVVDASRSGKPRDLHGSTAVHLAAIYHRPLRCLVNCAAWCYADLIAER